MRIFISILLTLSLIGATFLYSNFAAGIRPTPIEINVEMDHGQWKVLIDRTFDCVPDLEMGADAISVQLKGNDLFRKSETIKAAETLAIQEIDGIEEGANEIFVEANFLSVSNNDVDSTQQRRAMRVRIFRDLELVADQTFWSEPGDINLMASLSFEAPVTETSPDHHQD